MRKLEIKIIGIMLLLLTSCIQTEVLNLSVPQLDTVATKAQKPLKPMPQVDTSRVPIGFNPSVEDWEEEDIEL